MKLKEVLPFSGADKDHELNLQMLAVERQKYFRAVKRLFARRFDCMQIQCHFTTSGQYLYSISGLIKIQMVESLQKSLRRELYKLAEQRNGLVSQSTP